jgi:endonuclease/exonuclease/phosphatase family metal-dependent hydrolase
LSFVYGGLALEAAEPIRVMTFNIRYGTANDGPNHWKNRHELVVETIKNFKPDLLGTQEVLSFQADYLTEQLPGYAMVGVGRDDGKRMGEFSSLFYDTERFTLVDSGTFWLSETPNMPGSKSWDASLPRVASWAKLKDNRASGRELVFINTHWDHIGDRARTESGKIIHTWMGEKAANLPTIVTGDFNVNENHPGLAALMSSPSDSLKLQDAFRIVHPKQADDEATFHGFRGRTKGRRIDFILTSPQFQAIEATIDRTERDGRYPSDHYPVTAILEYK